MSEEPAGSETAVEFWDELYRTGEFPDAATASVLLDEWIEALPVGRALDVGAGVGLNASVLAETGFTVDAIDVSAEALSIGRSRVDSEAVNWIEADVTAPDQPPADAYDVVLVSQFPDLGVLRTLKDHLADGGYLLYEHHLQTTDEVTRGPSDAHIPNADAYRVRSNELLHAGLDLTVLHYRERTRVLGDGERAALAELVARNTRGGKQSYPVVE